MKKIMGQKKVVLDILRESSSLRTEQLKIEAMKQGVSCGDRYLRWLSEEGLISSYKKKGDATKTWAVIEKPAEPVYRLEGKQLCMI